MKKKLKAWHFVRYTLRDGSPIPPDGEVLRFDGPLVICESGLHASLQPFDALQYAPGNTLCYVECAGIGERHADKFVCSERTIIARMDFTEMLRYYARMCAVSVIEQYPNGTDDVVFDYLMTGDESIRVAALSAARLAAECAEDSVALFAADSAACAATYSAGVAAHSAADSAGGALYSAAGAAALSVARGAYRKLFNCLVYECFKGGL